MSSREFSSRIPPPSTQPLKKEHAGDPLLFRQGVPVARAFGNVEGKRGVVRILPDLSDVDTGARKHRGVYPQSPRIGFTVRVTILSLVSVSLPALNKKQHIHENVLKRRRQSLGAKACSAICCTRIYLHALDLALDAIRYGDADL